MRVELEDPPVSNGKRDKSAASPSRFAEDFKISSLPRFSLLGTSTTRTELSALPLSSNVPEGLNLREVTGKSWAWRMWRIGCVM